MSYVTYRITNKQLAAGVYQAFIVVYQSAYQFNFLIEHAVGVLSDQNNIAEVKFHGTTNNLYDLLLVTCVVFASLTLLVYR